MRKQPKQTCKCGYNAGINKTQPIICPQCDWNKLEHEYEYNLLANWLTSNRKVK